MGNWILICSSDSITDHPAYLLSLSLKVLLSNEELVFPFQPQECATGQASLPPGWVCVKACQQQVSRTRHCHYRFINSIWNITKGIINLQLAQFVAKSPLFSRIWDFPRLKEPLNLSGGGLCMQNQRQYFYRLLSGFVTWWVALSARWTWWLNLPWEFQTVSQFWPKPKWRKEQRQAYTRSTCSKPIQVRKQSSDIVKKYFVATTNEEPITLGVLRFKYHFLPPSLTQTHNIPGAKAFLKLYFLNYSNSSAWVFIFILLEVVPQL